MAAEKLSTDAATVDSAVSSLSGTRRRAKSIEGVALPKRILVCVDGTDSSENALSWAAVLAAAGRAKVSVITVLPPTPLYKEYAGRAGMKMSHQELSKLDTQNGQRILDGAVAYLKRSNVAAQPILARGSPAVEIEAAGRKGGFDLIVLGSHGHGRAERLFMGSVADSVKNHAKSSVLIAKQEFSKGPLLSPVDGSAESRAAAQVAVHLSKSWDVSTIIQHVYEVPWLGWWEEGKDEFRDIIAKYQLPKAPTNIRYVLEYGRPATQIHARAQAEKVRLVVLGARGMGLLRRATLGSVSGRLAHTLESSILIWRK